MQSQNVKREERFITCSRQEEYGSHFKTNILLEKKRGDFIEESYTYSNSEAC